MAFLYTNFLIHMLLYFDPKDISRSLECDLYMNEPWCKTLQFYKLCEAIFSWHQEKGIFFFIFEILFQNLVFFSWNKNLQAVGEISSVGDKNNSLTEKKLLLTKNQITKIKYWIYSVEEEAETFSLDLQLASVECLGQAWPENPDTQNEVIEELLNVLDAMIKNTTRKLQVSELLEYSKCTLV